MLKHTLAGCALLTLAACASSAPPDPRIAETRGAVEIEKTSFDKYQKFEGPKHRLSDDRGFALIRSWRDAPDSRATHQLYVHVTGQATEKEFLSANLPGGKSLEVKRIDTGPLCPDGSRAEGCPLFEAVGIYVSDGELRKAMRAGALRLRLNPKRGEPVIITLPDWYLTGYLDAF